jgi:hypothetical protein
VSNISPLLDEFWWSLLLNVVALTG